MKVIKISTPNLLVPLTMNRAARCDTERMLSRGGWTYVNSCARIVLKLHRKSASCSSSIQSCRRLCHFVQKQYKPLTRCSQIAECPAVSNGRPNVIAPTNIHIAALT